MADMEVRSQRMGRSISRRHATLDRRCKHIYLISFDSDIRHLGGNASGNIDFKKGYVLELPPLLFVCHESRNIMYDALLTFRYCTEK